MKKIALLLAMLAPVSASAQEVGDLVTFVACPVYRDTDQGRKSGCWLATDPASGVRWDVTESPYKPDYNHGTLVEGRVSTTEDNGCGGPMLFPVRTSRLTSIDCPSHILPPEEFPGRKFVLPKRNLTPIVLKKGAPEGPFEDRTFYTYFELNRDFLVYQYSDYLLDNAADWIRAAKPARVTVTGFAQTDPVEVSGMTIAESEDIAMRRAKSVALSLSRLAPGTNIEVKVETSARPIDERDADTLQMQSQRRVEIRAEM